MTNKKKGGLLAAVIAVITVVGVGTYTLDFSQNNSTNINDSGDEIINNFLGDLTRDGVMAYICTQDVIPESHTQACIIWENNT